MQRKSKVADIFRVVGLRFQGAPDMLDGDFDITLPEIDDTEQVPRVGLGRQYLDDLAANQAGLLQVALCQMRLRELQRGL